MYHSINTPLIVVDSSPDRKPVQLAQHMRDAITSFGAGDEPCAGSTVRGRQTHHTTISCSSLDGRKRNHIRVATGQ